MQFLPKYLIECKYFSIHEAVMAFIKKVIPSLKCSGNPFACVVILAFVIFATHQPVMGEERKLLKICKGSTVQTESQLLNLKDCDVIEGHLVLTKDNFDNKTNWTKLGGFKVREITDYLLIFMVDYLPPLDVIFPRLTVIRGNKLYMSYAFVVYGTKYLTAIGLGNLTTILKGSVFIDGNGELNGYVNAVDWNQITVWNNQSHCTHMNVIQEGVGSKSCNESCKVGDKEGFCWAPNVCQKVCLNSSACSPSGSPCRNDQCLGGCFDDNTGTNNCVACKGFRKRNTTECVASCDDLYEFDGYRCITKPECESMPGRKLQDTKEKLQGSTEIRTRKQCVTECFAGYGVNGSSRKCVLGLCSGESCQKICEGGLISSVEKAQKYQGCTVVNGSLEIRMFKLNPSLHEALGSIEVVEGYVLIFRSVELQSLNFLKSLRTIKGNELYKERYSFIAYENDNLRDLWNNNLTVVKGEVLFYANPVLCPQVIEKLVTKEKWSEQFPVLNGNKKACNIDYKLQLLLTPVDDGMEVNISRAFFEDSLKVRLSGFSVYYRMSDNATNGYQEGKDSMHFEPYNSKSRKYLSAKIANLEPFTNYTFYIETSVVHTNESFGNVRSDFFWKFTLPSNPTQPSNVTVSLRGKNFIEISWDPPTKLNGPEIYQYEVTYEQIHELGNPMDNLCGKKYQELINPPSSPKGNEDATPTSSVNTTSSNGTCSSIYRTREELAAIIKSEKDEIVNHFVRQSDHRRKREARSFSDLEYESIGNFVSKVLIKRTRSKREVSTKSPLAKAALPGPKAKVQLLLQSPSFPTPNINDIEDFMGNDDPCLWLKSFYESLPNMEPHDSYTEQCVENREVVGETSTEENAGNAIYERFLTRRRRSILEKKPIVEFVREGRRFSISHPKANGSYFVKIKACHKPFGKKKKCVQPCKCSNDSSIMVHVLPSESESRVRNVTVKESPNGVAIDWLPPVAFHGRHLAYVVNVTKVKGSEPELHCLTSTTAVINLTDAGNFSITVKSFSDSSEKFSSPIVTYYPNKIVVPTPSDYIIFLTVFTLIILTLVGILVYKKIKGPEFPDTLVTKNDNYVTPGRSSDPKWLEYFNTMCHSVSSIKEDKLKKSGWFNQGNFGLISKGYWKLDDGRNIYVAIKQAKQDPDPDLDMSLAKSFIDEAKLMSVLKSHHVVKFYGIVRTGHELNIVMEYMNLGNLRVYILDHIKTMNIFSLFSVEQVIAICTQIADGMEYLAFKSVIHMDLAARNCLLYRTENENSPLIVKVSDFGLARNVNDATHRPDEKQKFPARWMPPEYFVDGKYTTQLDVWSYGILLWEILNPGKTPYSDTADDKIREKIKCGVPMTIITNDFTKLLPDEISRQKCVTLISIVTRCWHREPETRPTFKTIINEFLPLTTVDFQNIFMSYSFHYCDELKDSEIYNTCSSALDEDEENASTPLTTPAPSTVDYGDSFRNTKSSGHLPKWSPRHVTPENLLNRIRNPRQWLIPKYNLDLTKFRSFFRAEGASLRSNINSSVDFHSNKPDVLPSSCGNDEYTERRMRSPREVEMA